MEDLRKYLEENKKIEIEKIFENNSIKHYKTALYKESETEYYFYKPKEQDNYIDFSENEKVKILIYTLDGIFTFYSTVVKNGTKVLKIAKPQNYKKIQRRGLLRVNLPIKVNIEFEKDNSIQSSAVKLVDISGSGISFNTDCDLLNIKRLNLRFSIAGKDIVSMGEIIEVRQNRNIEKGKYRLSVRFISLSASDADFIVKHCMIHQVKTRLKKEPDERG